MKDWVDHALAGVAATAVTAAGFASVATWVYQLYVFAKSGHWLPISAADGLHWMTGSAWYVAPDSWLGIQKILAFVNAGWAMLLAAAFVFAILVAMTEK